MFEWIGEKDQEKRMSQEGIFTTNFLPIRVNCYAADKVDCFHLNHLCPSQPDGCLVLTLGLLYIVSNVLMFGWTQFGDQPKTGWTIGKDRRISEKISILSANIGRVIETETWTLRRVGRHWLRCILLQWDCERNFYTLRIFAVIVELLLWTTTRKLYSTNCRYWLTYLTLSLFINASFQRHFAPTSFHVFSNWIWVPCSILCRSS